MGGAHHAVLSSGIADESPRARGGQRGMTTVRARIVKARELQRALAEGQSAVELYLFPRLAVCPLCEGSKVVATSLGLARCPWCRVQKCD
jgi:hypothetical protein